MFASVTAATQRLKVISCIVRAVSVDVVDHISLLDHTIRATTPTQRLITQNNLPDFAPVGPIAALMR